MVEIWLQFGVRTVGLLANVTKFGMVHCCCSVAACVPKVLLRKEDRPLQAASDVTQKVACVADCLLHHVSHTFQFTSSSPSAAVSNHAIYLVFGTKQLVIGYKQVLSVRLLSWKISLRTPIE